jgi:hypothetical protein
VARTDRETERLARNDARSAEMDRREEVRKFARELRATGDRGTYEALMEAEAEARRAAEQAELRRRRAAGWT